MLCYLNVCTEALLWCCHFLLQKFYQSQWIPVVSHFPRAARSDLYSCLPNPAYIWEICPYSLSECWLEPCLLSQKYFGVVLWLNLCIALQVVQQYWHPSPPPSILSKEVKCYWLMFIGLSSAVRFSLWCPKDIDCMLPTLGHTSSNVFYQCWWKYLAAQLGSNWSSVW